MEREPKFITTYDETPEHIIVTALSDDGTERLKKVFPLRCKAEAILFHSAVLKARSLRGFTRTYLQEQKQRAQIDAAKKSILEYLNKKTHDWLWDADGTPRSMVCKVNKFDSKE